jgi:hypothetical protein
MEAEMPEQREFHYRFDDLSPGALSTDLQPPRGAKIVINIEDGNKVWLSANPAGWLHLARICAELGSNPYELGFHFHRDFNFGDTVEGGPEITFEVGKDDVVGPQRSN